ITLIVGLIDRVAAPRQSVAVRHRYRGSDRIGGRPVALPMRGIAPAPARIPVPGLDSELGAQTVRYRVKVHRLHRGHVRSREDVVRRVFGVPVDGRAERDDWIESSYRITRIDGDGDVALLCE